MWKTCILAAVLVASPLTYAQQSTPDQQTTQPQAPAATEQSNTGQAGNANAEPGTLPQSDQGAQPDSSDQAVIYGTGLTSAELKQLGYADDEIAQMRGDSQLLVASSTVGTGIANSSQNRTPSAPASVSQPTETGARQGIQDHAGLWGLLGLLGLLGLAGRRARQQVVRYEAVDTTTEHDRMRYVEDREAAERAVRDRESIASGAYGDQDIVTQHDLKLSLREREERDRKVREIRDADRHRRRTA